MTQDSKRSGRQNYNVYQPSDWGDVDVELRRLFWLELQDARQYFLTVTKPRMDRAYKMYIGSNQDRARTIQKWQSNVSLSYSQAAIETLVPRIVDARPDFTVRGRSQDDELKAEKQQQLMDFLWEVAKMDTISEDFIRACLIYGTSYLQVSWKKDVRKLKFLDTKDIASKKYTWTEKEKVFYDFPFAEYVGPESLWYDWHNSARSSKQYWFKRLVLTEGDIRRRYPMADEERLQMAFHSPGGDLIDYAAIRPQTRTVNLYTTKESAANQISASGTVYGTDKYFSTLATQVKMFEVFYLEHKRFVQSFTNVKICRHTNIERDQDF